MRLLWVAVLAVSSLAISGCFFPPLLDGAGRLPKYSAPTGAYFIKPGMTREERLRDWAACMGRDSAEFCRAVEGRPKLFAACKEHCKLKPCFTQEQIASATIPKEQATPGQMTDGVLILLRKMRCCMTDKGYHELPRGECEGDQEYFPRCMWP